MLKTKHDDSSPNQRSCIAFKNGKCELYEKRPLVCRLYPIQFVEITESIDNYRPYSDHTNLETRATGIAVTISGCLATKELGFEHFEKGVEEAIKLFEESALSPPARFSIDYLERNRIKYRIIKRYKTE